MKLLIIDDDGPLADIVRHALLEDGFAVDVARSYNEGQLMATVYPYDGIVLDVMLPDGTGFSLLEELRRQGNEVPVLMVTSRDTEDDVIRGLDTGADDYLTKPFAVPELKARVRALVRRRATQKVENVQVVGDLVLDRLTHAVSRDGRRLKLTPKEFSLLEYFMLNAGRVVSRTELLEKVWELHFDPGSNVVDTHVARLRAKLERHDVRTQLVTVRGSGFMLSANA